MPTVTTSIIDDNDNFELCALWDEVKRKYVALWITWLHSSEEAWDNPDYIWNDFYPAVKVILLGQETMRDIKVVYPFYDRFNKDNWFEILKVLEKGISLGWSKIK